MMVTVITMADRLTEALADHEVSQSELARALGITQGTISLILLGKTRQSKHLPEIARYLGVSYDWLVGRSTDKHGGSAPYSPPEAVRVMLPVSLPSENALTAMFEGLLRAIGAADRGLTLDEQARELAQLLPTGLSQISGDLIELPRPPRSRPVAPVLPAAAEAAPSVEPEFQR